MAAQIGLHSHSCTLVRSWSRHQTVRKVDDSFAHSPLIAVARHLLCRASLWNAHGAALRGPVGGVTAAHATNPRDAFGCYSASRCVL